MRKQSCLASNRSNSILTIIFFLGLVFPNNICLAEPDLQPKIRSLRVVPNSETSPSKADGETWATAFSGLNAALEFIEKNPLPAGYVATELLLREGLYFNPAVDASGDMHPAQPSAFSLPGNVHLRGGFEGKDTDLKRANGRITEISGRRKENQTRASWINGNHFTVITVGSRLSPTTQSGPNVIENILVRDGRAASTGKFADDSSFDENEVENRPLAYGGGIFVRPGATVTMRNVVVTGNYSKLKGGGVYNSGQLTLENCTIAGNSSGTDGGGVATAPTPTTTPAPLSATASTQFISTIVAHNAANVPAGQTTFGCPSSRAATSTDDVAGPIAAARHSFFSSLPVSDDNSRKSLSLNLTPLNFAPPNAPTPLSPHYLSPGFLKVPGLPTDSIPGEAGGDFRLQRSGIVLERGEPTTPVPQSWGSSNIELILKKDSTSWIVAAVTTDDKTKLTVIGLDGKTAELPLTDVGARKPGNVSDVRSALKFLRKDELDISGNPRYQGQRLDQGAYEYTLNGPSTTIVAETAGGDSTQVKWKLWRERKSNDRSMQIASAEQTTKSIDDLFELASICNSNEIADDDIGRIWLRTGTYKLQNGMPLQLIPFVEIAGGFAEAKSSTATSDDEVVAALKELRDPSNDSSSSSSRVKFLGRTGAETILDAGGKSAVMRGHDCEGVTLDRLVIMGGSAPRYFESTKFAVTDQANKLKGVIFGSLNPDLLLIHPFKIVLTDPQVWSIHSIDPAQAFALRQDKQLVYVNFKDATPTSTGVSYPQEPSSPKQPRLGNVHRLLAASVSSKTATVYVIADCGQSRPEACKLTIDLAVTPVTCTDLALLTTHDAPSPAQSSPAEDEGEGEEARIRRTGNFYRFQDDNEQKKLRELYPYDLRKNVHLSNISKLDCTKTDAIDLWSNGGGLILWQTFAGFSSGVAMNQVAFLRNMAAGNGGAIWCSTQVALNSCTLVDNSCSGEAGGGVYAASQTDGQRTTLTNSILARNLRKIDQSQEPNDLFGNIAPASKSNFIGTVVGVAPPDLEQLAHSNFLVNSVPGTYPTRKETSNPLSDKTLEQGLDTPAHWFIGGQNDQINTGRPTRNAPFVNLGARTDSIKGERDLRGTLRIQGNRIDIGAYEYPFEEGADGPASVSLGMPINLLFEAAVSPDNRNQDHPHNRIKVAAQSNIQPGIYSSIRAALLAVWKANSNEDYADDIIEVEVTNEHHETIPDGGWNFLELPPFVGITSADKKKQARIVLGSLTVPPKDDCFFQASNVQGVVLSNIAFIPIYPSTVHSAAASKSSVVPPTVPPPANTPPTVAPNAVTTLPIALRVSSRKSWPSDVAVRQCQFENWRSHAIHAVKISDAPVDVNPTRLLVWGSEFVHNGSTDCGGALLSTQSELIAIESFFDRNCARNASGGAVAVEGGVFYSYACTFQGNEAGIFTAIPPDPDPPGNTTISGFGGAVAINKARLVMADSTLAYNRAMHRGGAISFCVNTPKIFFANNFISCNGRSAAFPKNSDLHFSQLSTEKLEDPPTKWNSTIDSISYNDSVAPSDLAVTLTASLAPPNYFGKPVKTMTPLWNANPPIRSNLTDHVQTEDHLPDFVKKVILQVNNRSPETVDSSYGAVGRPLIIPYVTVVVKNAQGVGLSGEVVTLVFNDDKNNPTERRTVSGPDGRAVFRQVPASALAKPTLRHADSKEVTITPDSPQPILISNPSR